MFKRKPNTNFFEREMLMTIFEILADLQAKVAAIPTVPAPVTVDETAVLAAVAAVQTKVDGIDAKLGTPA